MRYQKRASEFRRFADATERQSVARFQETTIIIETNREFHGHSCIREERIGLQLHWNFLRRNLVLWIGWNRFSVLDRERPMFDDLFFKIDFPIGDLTFRTI